MFSSFSQLCSTQWQPLLAKTSEASSQWVWLAVAALIGGAWYALYRFNGFRLARRGEGGDKSSPAGLMSELAAAHNLSRIERSLLSEAAAARNLRDPALLFVDPRLLNGLAEPRNAKAPEYAALAKKLFG